MQNNSKVGVEELIKATNRVYESRYENPTIEDEQIDNVEKFVTDTSNNLCSKIIKKINIGLL
jgi:replicative DNA helicase